MQRIYARSGCIFYCPKDEVCNVCKIVTSEGPFGPYLLSTEGPPWCAPLSTVITGNRQGPVIQASLRLPLAL